MIRRIGEGSASLAQKYMPDPFIFAIFLTFIVYILGLVFTPNDFLKMWQHWYNGFWNLLAFSMQMVLVLVTGYALAMAPAVNRVLRRLSSLPSSAGSAVVMVSFIALLANWINWGFGLIVGAVMALEVGKQMKMKGVKFHFPLAAAAAYAGNVIWHGGLSGSAPLLVNTPKHFLESKIGLISTGQTIFTFFNLVTIGVTILIVPFILRAMHPVGSGIREIDDSLILPMQGGEAEVAAPKPQQTFAERLENSRIVAWAIGLAGLYAIYWYFSTDMKIFDYNKGFGLNLDIVNFVFLIVGLILHGTPAAYVRVMADAVRTASGVVLQFPFYAGIMGMMTGSGLVTVIAGWFVAISTPATYAFWTFVSACLVNLAVPSGGGQWSVQGPVMVEAAQMLKFDIGRTIMAVAYGDQLTNMLQPFWAIPILGLTRLKAGQVMGYTVVVMFVVFVIYALGLTFLP